MSEEETTAHGPESPNPSPDKTPSPIKDSEAVWDQYISQDVPTSDPAGEPTAIVPDTDPEAEAGPSPRSLPETAAHDDLLLTDPDDMIDPVSLKLDEIRNGLDRLQTEFESKLKYDAHKNKIIDGLHQELQQYKDDILRQQVKPLVMDMIQFIDNFRKLVQHYTLREPSSADPEKLLSLLGHVPSDLEDILSRQGVTPFTCDSNTFDPGRQRVLKRVETTEASKDKTVAESLHPGYEWDDNIIRPEMVAVYVCKSAPAEEVRNSDE